MVSMHFTNKKTANLNSNKEKIAFDKIMHSTCFTFVYRKSRLSKLWVIFHG